VYSTRSAVVDEYEAIEAGLSGSLALSNSDKPLLWGVPAQGHGLCQAGKEWVRRLRWNVSEAHGMDCGGGRQTEVLAVLYCHRHHHGLG